MKNLFIVNPTAGGKDRSEDIREMAVKVFADRPEDSFEIYRTTGPKDATREIKERAAAGEEFRVFSCGGDGTFNECCNGAAGFKNVSVAPFPYGTGNDFIRMFGEEGKYYRDLGALVEGHAHPIDLIDVNGLYSASIASVGVDARIGTNVHNYTGLPFLGNSAAYVVSCVVEIFKGINTKMKITCGDYQTERSVALCSVCNGRFYGGGFQPTKDAMPDDGILDIFICKKMNLLSLAGAIGKYSSGRSDEIPNVIKHLKGDSITIETEKPVRVNIDGEAIDADRVEIKLVPGIMNLIVPKGMTFFDR